MIGQTISHYKILEKLGEGGMGVVYKAQDTKLDRTVALKFLPHHLTAQEPEKARFLQEARAASSLNHPNICTIHAIEETEDQQFIVMEYVDGQTLRNLKPETLKPQALKPETILSYAIQIGEALQEAHGKGIVHRDIKADNIMINTRNQVKVMDFGLAKLKGSLKLTRTSSTVGTLAYMAPEQIQGGEVDARSDIFSFGVMLFEMLTGRSPFRGEHEAAMMYSIMNEEPEQLDKFLPDVSPELKHVVNRALEKDPEDRYQSAHDMVIDLRRLKKESTRVSRAGIPYPVPSHAQAESATEVPVPSKLSLRRIAIPSAIVLALAIAIAGYFFLFKGEESFDRTSEEPRNTFAVMYFENIPDPEDKDHTGEMLSNLLTTSLSQIKGLEVISLERLQEVQNEFGQGEAKSLTAAQAIQVAKRAGVNTMLLGSILQKQPKLAVTTRLIEVQSGRIITSQRVTNFTGNEIFNLIDSLASLIRNDLNITSPETKSVAEVTTKSPQAYRAYVEGLQLLAKLYNTEARATFARAVELDKDFAMAYFFLSLTQRSSGDLEAANASLERAVELSDKTPERERLRIIAESYGRKGDPRKAAETLEKLLEQYPHEKAYIDLSITYNSLLEQEKSLQVLQRGLKIDPADKTLWNLAGYGLADLNRKQEALDAMNQYLKLAPGEPNPYDSKGDIHVKFGEHDSARFWYKKAITFRRDFASATKLGLDAVIRQSYKEAEEFFQMSGNTFPIIETHSGQFKNARNRLTGILSHPKTPFEMIVAMSVLTHLSYESRDYPEMLRFARDLSSQLKRIPQNKIYGRDYVAWALVKNGKSTEAHRTLEEIKRDVDPRMPRLQVTSDYAEALIALEEGEYEAAVGQFRKIYRSLSPNRDPNLLFGISLLKKGELGEAVTELERLSNWFPIIGSFPTLPENPGSAFYWPISSVEAHYWLGVAHEQQGEKEKAIKAYEKFLDIWKDADFKSAALADAKTRLVALKATAIR